MCIKWIINKSLLYKKINKIKFKNSKKKEIGRGLAKRYIYICLSVCLSVSLSGRAQGMKMVVSHVTAHQITSTAKEAFGYQVDVMTCSTELVNVFPQWSQCLLNGPMNKEPMVEGMETTHDLKTWSCLFQG